MRLRSLVLAALAALGLLVGHGPHAARAEEGGATYVLVVGVNAYADARIPALRFAESDARAVYAFFATEKRSPTVRDRVTLLVGKDATRAGILRAIRERLQQRAARPEDTVILYFAGHGFADAQTTYLAPSDARLGDLPETAISSETLAEYWGRVRAGRKVVVLDACHAGGIESVRGIGGVALAPLAAPVAGAAGATPEGPLSLNIAATGPSELSTEDPDLGQGVFTIALLKGLRGEADADGDGVVLDAELARFLASEVPALAASAGGRQTPSSKRVGPEAAAIALSRSPGAALPAAASGALSAGATVASAPTPAPPSASPSAPPSAAPAPPPAPAAGAPPAKAAMPPFTSSAPLENATTSLQALIDAAADGATIRVPRARYVMKEALAIKGRYLLTIEAEPGAEVVNTSDVEVISIEKSAGIRIHNLKAGHLLPENLTCGTPVVDIRESKSIELTGCELYGCGVVGVSGRDVTGLLVERCFLHHNINCALEFIRSRDIRIRLCRIEDNGGLVESEDEVILEGNSVARSGEDPEGVEPGADPRK